MPVDRSHAFAGGGVFERPSAIARFVGTAKSRAWRSFDAGASLEAGLRLGRNAWCANDGSRDRIRVGRDVVCRGIVRRETFGDGVIEIGDDVYIGDDCIISCAVAVTIGTGAMLGHEVQIFDNNSHPVDAQARALDWHAVRVGGARGEIATAPVVIGEHAWIGFRSLVLKGVTIGSAAIVGAGSVVTRDVPGGSVVAGNPAEPI